MLKLGLGFGFWILGFGFWVLGLGSGNTLNCNHPVVTNLILDSLRHW